VTWVQPYPDEWNPESRYQAREYLELGFVVALQRLPPRQVASLLLCDVLGFSMAEAATMLDSNATAVKGLLQRARASLALRRDSTGAEPSPRPGSPSERQLTERFVEAFTAGDVGAILALLTDTAWLAMPPAPHEYHGHSAIGAFLTASRSWRGMRATMLLATRANSQPAFGCYLGARDGLSAEFTGIMVLSLSGDRIGAVSRFLDPTLADAFSLPSEVEMPPRSSMGAVRPRTSPRSPGGARRHGEPARWRAGPGPRWTASATWTMGRAWPWRPRHPPTRHRWTPLRNQPPSLTVNV
jgi:RNA polymerase sigma-70 factor (ECF subfamily)